MRTNNRTIATAVLLNANYNSPSQPLKNIYTYSMVALITGTPTGTVRLQASNDPETNDISTGAATAQNATPSSPPAVGPTHWTDITDSTFTVTTAGETMWNVNAVGYNYVRVVYTDTSGGTSTATMTIIYNGKGV